MKPVVTEEADEENVWTYQSLKKRGNKKKRRSSGISKVPPNIAHQESPSDPSSQGKVVSKDTRNGPLKRQDGNGTKTSTSVGKSGQKRGKLSQRESNVANNNGTNNKTKAVKDGYCPFCQVPFSILLIQSPSWHVMECMEFLPLSSSEECPAGLQCDVTIESHYKKFTHSLLANMRAGCNIGKSCGATNKSDDQETPVDQAKRKLTFSSLKPAGLDMNGHFSETSVICELEPEAVETPIDVAKKKLNFSENKRIKEEISIGDLEKCSCDKNENLNQNEFDIDQAKRKLSFTSTRKVDSALSQSIASPGMKMCHQCFKPKDSSLDSDSPYFLPVNVDTPKLKFVETERKPVQLRIENVVSLAGNAKEISDGSDKGYQSEEDIFGDLGMDEEIMTDMCDDKETLAFDETVSGKNNTSSGNKNQANGNKADQMGLGDSQMPSRSQAAPRKGGRKSHIAKETEHLKDEVCPANSQKSSISQSTSINSGRKSQVAKETEHLKDDVYLTNSQKSSLSQSTPRKGGRRSQAVKDGNQPSIFSFFQKKPFDQGGKCSDLQPNEGQGRQSTSRNNLPLCDNNTVLDTALKRKHSDDIRTSHNSKDNGCCLNRESDIVTYRFSSKPSTSEDSRNRCGDNGEDIDCDTIHPDSACSELPEKLRKKSVAENVTSLLSSAISNTRSALGLLKYPSDKTPWPLKESRTSKAGQSSSIQSSVSSSASEGPSKKLRKCPFYKKIPGTAFTVDAFSYGSIPGCTAYFLSHFHYDHYGGLKKSFDHPLYCTKVTANLVEKKIRVSPQYIKTLDLNTPTVIEGVEVTMVDANHCPGSVLMLFKLRDGTVHLHTGDFRASEEIRGYPELQHLSIDTLFLDTTYCDPVYAFPPQKDVIQFSVNKATDFVHANPNTLVVVGSYTIGKERIFLAIAEALNVKVCVTREKKGILDCLEDEMISKRLTLNMTEARVHVLPMKQLNYTALEDYLGKLKPRFDKVLAFEPTGWTHSKKATSLEDIRPKVQRGRVTLYGVPYSEHSSYTELKSFTQFTKPRKILPTVNNGNPASRKKMEELFAAWMKELDASPRNLMKQGSMNGWLQSN